MIIPIRAPENGESTDQVEWVMIELNGELLKPLDEIKSSATKSALPMSADEMKRRVELGSIKFDSDVSSYADFVDVCIFVIAHVMLVVPMYA